MTMIDYPIIYWLPCLRRDPARDELNSERQPTNTVQRNSKVGRNTLGQQSKHRATEGRLVRSSSLARSNKKQLP
jgi:hypothetical protein